MGPRPRGTVSCYASWLRRSFSDMAPRPGRGYLTASRRASTKRPGDPRAEEYGAGCGSPRPAACSAASVASARAIAHRPRRSNRAPATAAARQGQGPRGGGARAPAVRSVPTSRERGEDVVDGVGQVLRTCHGRSSRAPSRCSRWRPAPPGAWAFRQGRRRRPGARESDERQGPGRPRPAARTGRRAGSRITGDDRPRRGAAARRPGRADDRLDGGEAVATSPTRARGSSCDEQGRRRRGKRRRARSGRQCARCATQAASAAATAGRPGRGGASGRGRAGRGGARRPGLGRRDGAVAAASGLEGPRAPATAAALARRRRASALGVAEAPRRQGSATTPGLSPTAARGRRARRAAPRGCRARAAAGAAPGRCALAELARQVAALAAQRRQVRAEPARAATRRRASHRVDAGQRLVQRPAPASRGPPARAGRPAPRPARAPCRPACRPRRRCGSSASPPTTRATPKSVSLASCARLGGCSGISTLDGLTSRWTTPCAWAWASASHSATPMRTMSRSDSRPAASNSSSVVPRTSSETR